MKKNQIALLFVIGAAIAFIISTGGDYSRYTDFEAAFQNEGKVYQVIGQLDKTVDIMYQPEKNPNYFSFSMIDKEGEKQKVIFHGPPPADFERSEDVVINGKAENGQFIATKILLKCPSKYEDGKMEEQSFEAQG